MYLGDIHSLIVADFYEVSIKKILIHPDERLAL